MACTRQPVTCKNCICMYDSLGGGGEGHVNQSRVENVRSLTLFFYKFYLEHSPTKRHVETNTKQDTGDVDDVPMYREQLDRPEVSALA